MRIRMLALVVAVGVGAATAAMAQPSPKDFPEVTDTSFVEANGERVLRLSVVVPADQPAVWRRLTTADGYRMWATPMAEIDFRAGGLIESNYSSKAKLGDPENIKNRILAYTPGRMFAIRNEQAPSNLPGREVFGDIVTVMDLEAAGPNATRVNLTAVGYQPKEPYLALYRHFAWGNAHTLMKLKESFTRGPIDWKSLEARREAQAASAKVMGTAR